MKLLYQDIAHVIVSSVVALVLIDRGIGLQEYLSKWFVIGVHIVYVVSLYSMDLFPTVMSKLIVYLTL